MATAEAPPEPARALRSSYRRAGVLGAIPAAAVFLFVLLDGKLSLLRRVPIASDFFDAQARSLLDGRWNVSPKSLFFEGFLVNGKVYEYFGPVPAVLRMPVTAVTHELDGRLGQLSMLLAFAVALLFTVRLAMRIRPLVRGDAPVTRGETWAVGTFTFLVGAGSVLVFLASRSWAFHESEIWGVAFALGAFELVIAWTVAPTYRRLALASGFTTLALLTRASVGLAPLGALGVLLVAGLFAPTRRLVGMAGSRGLGRGRVALALGVAILVPVALFAYVNDAKFGTLFSVPWDAHLQSRVLPFHRKVLAANHGSLLGAQFVPTTVLQYLRPDAIHLEPLFPWVTFAPPSRAIGGVVLERVESSSVPASMPALTLLGLVGLVGIVRPRATTASEPGLASLRAVVLGAFGAAFATLGFAYVAQRYLSDFLPGLVVCAIAGLHLVLRWSAARAESSRGSVRGTPVRRLAWIGLGGLVVVSVWFNLGLALMYQKTFWPVTKRDLVGFVGFQHDVHDVVPGGSPPRVRTGTALPKQHQGTVFVLGDCAALYYSDGQTWRTLERSERGGRFRLRVRFPAGPTDWQPVVVNGTGPTAQVFAVRVLPGARVQFGYDVIFTGKEVRIVPGHVYDLDVLMDPVRGRVEARLDGKLAYSTTLPNKIIGERLRPLTNLSLIHI